jgi:hypothetical protein
MDGTNGEWSKMHADLIAQAGMVDSVLTWQADLSPQMREALTGLANLLDVAIVQASRVRTVYRMDAKNCQGAATIQA